MSAPKHTQRTGVIRSARKGIIREVHRYGLTPNEKMKILLELILSEVDWNLRLERNNESGNNS